MEKPFCLKDMKEKRMGRGEDSDPISLALGEAIITGVFDGMGGAGSAEQPSDYSKDGFDMTKAYIGSRIVRDAIESFLRDNPDCVRKDGLEEQLKSIIIDRFIQEKEKYPPKSKSLLRSSLIKEYPTTLAITCAYKSHGNYVIDSYWAGDSRNFLWTSDGLYQISIDDLEGDINPLENLHEDAPISNCVQADGDFIIRHNRLNPSKPFDKFAIISATDGCFGYYPSPMDFEGALRDMLKKSKSFDDLKENLSKAFSDVTADDFSFSFGIIGFDDFKEFKSKLLNSKDRDAFKGYFKLREKIFEDQKKLISKQQKADSDIDTLWPLYKESYLKFLKIYEER